MALVVRHYHDRFTKTNPAWGFSIWGFSRRHRRLPTLDLYLGKHMFAIFWKRNENGTT